jgi:hypothetical protein
MTDKLYMEVAGIGFSIISANSAIKRNPLPAYLQFVGRPAQAAGNEVIEINLELGHLPETENMSKIFDSQEAWSMFSDQNNYFLKFSPRVFNQPLWIARFDRGFNNTTIYCGEPSLSKADGSVLNPICYPLDQILLMYLLSQREGCLIHSAGFGIRGRGCIFPGKSGAGKSTLSRQFFDVSGGTFLSDDRIIIRKIDNVFRAFGTPWPGDAGIAENRSLPLSGLFFIRHGDKNMIKEIKPKEALERLMPVTSIPWYDEKAMSDMLSFCEDLVLNIPAYELYFRPDKEVVDYFEKFISA